LSKIFRYELRRLVWNKFFLGLLIINGVYAWYTLTHDIIAGIAYTAPFSPWSFGAYLAKVMPLAVLTVLFLISTYFSKKEKQAEVLTTATPVNPVAYSLVRCGAVAVCFLIISALVIALGDCFYAFVFAYRNFSAFILPSFLILLPCFLFALGIGYLAGRIHPVLLYVLMLVALVAGFAGIGGAFDFFGAGYFGSRPLTLPVGADGEPAFTLGAGFWTARVVYLALGVIVLVIGISAFRHKTRKV
jgi:hypothetical protein